MKTGIQGKVIIIESERKILPATLARELFVK